MSIVLFQKFNENFFRESYAGGAKTIRWFDKKGIFHFNQGSRAPSGQMTATIELIAKDTHGIYTGYLVRIVNPRAGELDQHHFNFNTYMSDRSDGLTDLDGRYIYNGGFSIIEACCTDGKAGWYIAVPSEEAITEMADQILRYIFSWGDQ